MHPPEPSGPRQWTAGACAFVVLGLLILVPSGLCTGTFSYMTILEIVEGKDVAVALSDGFFVLAISGSFLAGAVFLIRHGFKQRKPK
jgi:uncharacterized membrane protein YjjB (DUF3815 family)